MIEYGRHLLRLDDPKGHVVLSDAVDLVLAVKEAATAPTPTVASLLEYLLTVSPQQSLSRISVAEAIGLVRRWFFASPPLLWLLAQQAYQAGEFQDAADLLERLVYLGHTKTYDHSAAFDPTLMAEQALLNMGNCYLRLGNPDRAETYFRGVLSSPAYQAQARQGVAMVEDLRRRMTL